MSVRGMWSVVCLVGLLVGGCASSGGRTTDDQEATSSEAAGSEAEGETEAPAEEEKSNEEPDHPVVEVDEIIGQNTKSGLPQGCPGEWEELEGRKFPGKLYSCEGFHVPERYKEPTVIVGVEEETVRRVSLQAFYEAGDEVRRMYNEVTNDYQKRCDREGGGGGRMTLQCDEFLVDISFRKETGALRLVLGLENWDLPH